MLITVLSEALVCNDKLYRATLERNDKDKLVVRIYQPTNGANGYTETEWSGCGTWALSTLLFGWPEDLDNMPSDGLSIDFGQNWRIESGMRDALKEAIKWL